MTQHEDLVFQLHSALSSYLLFIATSDRDHLLDALAELGIPPEEFE